MQVQEVPRYSSDSHRYMARGEWSVGHPVGSTGQHPQRQAKDMVEETQRPLLSGATPVGWGSVDGVLSLKPHHEMTMTGGSQSFPENFGVPNHALGYSAQAIISTLPTEKFGPDANRETMGPSSEVTSENEVYSEIEAEAQAENLEHVSSTIKTPARGSRKRGNTNPVHIVCPVCNFGTEDRDLMMNHLKCHVAATQDSPEDSRFMNKYPDLREPRIGADGKVKVHHCKKCTHKALTKCDYWIHLKEHVPEDKRLNCELCPFMTGYKHHYEYHVNKHQGQNPYKCEKCSYTCVNKSMLSSHWKSHSSVHQFQCKTCGYSTKYMHTLKIHLRRFKHEPDIARNPDGTLNLLNPYIDVHGKRRGPRSVNKSSLDVPTPIPETKRMKLPETPGTLPFPPSTQFLGDARANEQNWAMKAALYRNFLLQTTPVTMNVLMGQPETIATPAFSDYWHKMQQFQVDSARTIWEAAGKAVKEDVVSSKPENRVFEQSAAPLDLRKYEENEDKSRKISGPEVIAIPKRRRKGKAVKLDLQRVCLSSEDESDAENPVDNVVADESASSVEERLVAGNYLFCEHCDMYFGKQAMYELHMRFHSSADPLKCTICGYKSAKDEEFYLHSHSSH